MNVLGSAWTPDQWVFVITALVTSVSGMVCAIIAALKSHAVQQQVKLPSNGATIGALTEGIAQVQHYLAAMVVDNKQTHVEPPAAAIDIARDLIANPPPPTPTNPPATP